MSQDFYLACEGADLEAAKSALSLEDVNYECNVYPFFDECALFTAVRAQSVPIIRWLLHEAGARGDHVSCDGDSWTALHVAAPCTDPHVMRTLLEHAPCRKLIDHKAATTQTPLDISVINGAAWNVRALLAYGADESCTRGTWCEYMVTGRRACRTAAVAWMARWRTILAHSGNGHDVATLVASHVLATQWYAGWCK